MLSDLSNVKEVSSVSGPCQDYVNEKLQSGKWMLLEVKIAEEQYWCPKQIGEEAHLHKGSDIVYVLGRIK